MSSSTANLVCVIFAVYAISAYGNVIYVFTERVRPDREINQDALFVWRLVWAVRWPSRAVFWSFVLSFRFGRAVVSYLRWQFGPRLPKARVIR